MPPRGYVLVFVFWALLTIITPTLIFWSASAKPNEEEAEVFGIKVISRRMMGSIESIKSIETTKSNARKAFAIAKAPAPAPTPTPSSDPNTGKYDT